MEKRDEYSNLILLCPTHHSEIDKFLEKWVSERLEQGLISYRPIDISKFLEKIKDAWSAFASSKVWMIGCLTPLRVEDDSIDPLENGIIETINNIEMPDDGFWDRHLNTYHTRPNENGIVNLNISDLENGYGHKISVFRNGHCEFLFCLEASVKRITGYAREKESNAIGSSRVIRYTHLAEVMLKQNKALKTIWARHLPFKNMALTFEILNTQNTLLFSRKKEGGGDLYGFPVEANQLNHTLIVDKEFDEKIIIDLILKRFVNYFGMVLNQFYNIKGKFSRPKKL